MKHLATRHLHAAKKWSAGRMLAKRAAVKKRNLFMAISANYCSSIFDLIAKKKKESDRCKNGSSVQGGQNGGDYPADGGGTKGMTYTNDVNSLAIRAAKGKEKLLQEGTTLRGEGSSMLRNPVEWQNRTLDEIHNAQEYIPMAVEQMYNNKVYLLKYIKQLQPNDDIAKYRFATKYVIKNVSKFYENELLFILKTFAKRKYKNLPLLQCTSEYFYWQCRMNKGSKRTISHYLHLCSLLNYVPTGKYIETYLTVFNYSKDENTDRTFLFFNLIEEEINEKHKELKHIILVLYFLHRGRIKNEIYDTLLHMCCYYAGHLSLRDTFLLLRIVLNEESGKHHLDYIKDLHRNVERHIDSMTQEDFATYVNTLLHKRVPLEQNFFLFIRVFMEKHGVQLSPSAVLSILKLLKRQKFKDTVILKKVVNVIRNNFYHYTYADVVYVVKILTLLNHFDEPFFSFLFEKFLPPVGTLPSGSLISTWGYKQGGASTTYKALRTDEGGHPHMDAYCTSVRRVHLEKVDGQVDPLVNPVRSFGQPPQKKGLINELSHLPLHLYEQKVKMKVEACNIIGEEEQVGRDRHIGEISFGLKYLEMYVSLFIYLGTCGYRASYLLLRLSQMIRLCLLAGGGPLADQGTTTTAHSGNVTHQTGRFHNILHKRGEPQFVLLHHAVKKNKKETNFALDRRSVIKLSRTSNYLPPQNKCHKNSSANVRRSREDTSEDKKDLSDLMYLNVDMFRRAKVVHSSGDLNCTAQMGERGSYELTERMRRNSFLAKHFGDIHPAAIRLHNRRLFQRHFDELHPSERYTEKVPPKSSIERDQESGKDLRLIRYKEIRNLRNVCLRRYAQLFKVESDEPFEGLKRVQKTGDASEEDGKCPYKHPFDMVSDRNLIHVDDSLFVDYSLCDNNRKVALRKHSRLVRRSNQVTRKEYSKGSETNDEQQTWRENNPSGYLLKWLYRYKNCLNLFPNEGETHIHLIDGDIKQLGECLQKWYQQSGVETTSNAEHPTDREKAQISLKHIALLTNSCSNLYLFDKALIDVLLLHVAKLFRSFYLVQNSEEQKVMISQQLNRCATVRETHQCIYRFTKMWSFLTVCFQINRFVKNVLSLDHRHGTLTKLVDLYTSPYFLLNLNHLTYVVNRMDALAKQVERPSLIKRFLLQYVDISTFTNIFFFFCKNLFILVTSGYSDLQLFHTFTYSVLTLQRDYARQWVNHSDGLSALPFEGAPHRRNIEDTTFLQCLNFYVMLICASYPVLGKEKMGNASPRLGKSCSVTDEQDGQNGRRCEEIRVDFHQHTLYPADLCGILALSLRYIKLLSCVRDFSPTGMCMNTHRDVRTNALRQLLPILQFYYLLRRNIRKKNPMNVNEESFSDVFPAFITKWLNQHGCFLCDSEVLPTLNTFIVLDIVIQMLKGSKGGRSKAKRGVKKKALYLTNRTMMEKFPPNFTFMLDFLNGELPQGEEHSLLEEGGAKLDKPNGEGNSFLHTTPWNIHTVKNVKKGTVERVTPFEPSKEHLSLEKFKQILERIHIKYIEGEDDKKEKKMLFEEMDTEKRLSEALFNLNEQKEYNWIVVNLAFLFVKDKKKINTYTENISLHYLCGKTKDTCTDSLNNTKGILFPNRNRNRNRNDFPGMLIERDIYDVPFFSNMLSFHFCYSFLVNFAEHLNHDRGTVTIGNAVESHVRGTCKGEQRHASRGEFTRGRSNKYHLRGRTHHRNAEPTERLPPNDQHTTATKLDKHPLENHSLSRKRKLEEMDGGELLSGGYSGASLGDKEGSTTDTAPSEGSDGEWHTHVEDPNMGHLNNLPDPSNDNPRREHIPKDKTTHAEDSPTPRKRKKKKGNKKGNKKHLYTFDVVPKSEKYKKIYLNMLSLYCDCICLIS
ncbi:Uncharacterized protein PCOAH_00026500 [Plasmodium coatneyi]|uniref:Uncharacterized protein n=1 Tax=Plasmodium coatneyi TaxID=208452 RepID=A0A1B1E049_9APIC|nr:Uncharacterized protein PCOAH_00026500 [Plasmodium coatneyi]ANQ08411.1 Uncharacterized protein PCOAH_00026500 [Plasmodium coatneyi]